MTFLTNAGKDPAEFARKLAEAEELERFNAGYDLASKRAEVDGKGWLSGATPEVVEAGSDAHLNLEFSYENDSGKEKREISRIREARAYGKLQPRQFVDHGTHVEYVFDGDHPIKAMAEKLFCIRCREAQPEDAHIALEGHRRIAANVPYHYEIPKNPKDNCCYCGAVLGGKQEVA